MSAPTASPDRIVVGIATDWQASGVVAWVAEHALTWGCPVVIVHGWLEFQVSTTGMSEEAWIDPTIWEKASKRPGAEVAEALRQRGLTVSMVTRQDSASHALLAVAQPGDLVALGALRGRVFRHAFSANVVHHLLRSAPCPVAVIPDAWQPSARDARAVMVAFDSTERATAALRWGLAESSLTGSPLVLVRALVPGEPTPSDVADDARLLAGARQLAAEYGVSDVSLRDVSNALTGTAQALEDAAADGSMLVLGNHRASWLAEISRASVAERVATIASTPMVVIPGPREPGADAAGSALRSPPLLP